MQHNLLLMRHGKSDWNTLDSDFDRPLNSRGRIEVQKISNALLELSIDIDCIISSSACRTSETTEIVVKHLTIPEHAVIFTEKLYLADMFTIIEVIDEYAAVFGPNVMIIAHNPGLDNIVNYLSATEPPLSNNGKLMTTSAVAVFQYDKKVKAHSLTLNQLLRPKEL